ncbi:hypothetical protein KFL_000820260 [Klebsormidium nitens]|uniref:TATA element modulatory factor 1 TATA binding domain-containing protein n=1 Tax=Klebsormidium nitens TaxID=105231 RepID=A0A1Y1I084_KLENI|nr:hypothetical protein KFL_000820260 [Klebsormidium nitens]|eukprot:GAQ81518.1 hypothetical protein KFL_000820260 [Klebsormidium nitens]
MAWAGFPKVSLGDLAGAVNKLQESVKSIEKNFDSALGLDQLQKPAQDAQDASTTAAPAADPPGASALDGWGWGVKAEIAKAQSSGAATATQATDTPQQAEPMKASGSNVPKPAPVPIQSLRKEAPAKGLPPLSPPGTGTANSVGNEGAEAGEEHKADAGAETKPSVVPPLQGAKGGTDVAALARFEAAAEPVEVPPTEETLKTGLVVEAKEKGTSAAVLSSATAGKEPGQQAGGKKPVEDQVSSGGPETAVKEEAAAGASASVNAPMAQAKASAADASAPGADVTELQAGVSASGTDGVETTEDEDAGGVDTGNAGVRSMNAPPEPVTLARIVGGVEASQPFGHGEATSQEESVASPKINLASAFPAAAAPQFKPHAEVDSVVDLVSSDGRGDVRTSGLGLVSEGESTDMETGGNERETVHLEVGERAEGTEEKQVGKSQEGSAENALVEESSAVFPVSKNAEMEATTSCEKPEIPKAPAVEKVAERADTLKGGADKEDDGRGGVGKGREVKVASEGEAAELARLREELKAMEVALQHAAKQAQTRTNELAEMGTANDNLRAELEDVKRKKTDESDLEALRAEYQHRLGTAERKVYALTKERDMLRRESSRKSDTSTLLKEKDEIIKQVMAEGEELSKKQAAVEGQMRKLRGTIRELEVERDRLVSRLQVEEAKTESIQKDKAKTERQLADAVERAQAELTAQKESYTAALQETKEALARAEAAADSSKRSELDKQVKEAAEREAELVRQLEEVREQMVRDAQSAAAREDRLRRDVRELEARCQDAEARHSELIARVPDSTRPLLRQIEALQEAASSRAESWGAVERTLNARVQEAEVAAAGAQERERSAADRLTQAASRMAVMEAQVSMLRAEQSALQRSLEKERARAGETRQELLALKEAAATHEGRASQLEDEMKDLRTAHRKEAQEAARKRDALEQELEALRAEREKLRAGQAPAVHRGAPERNGGGAGESVADATSERRMSRRPSNASSAGSSMEEGFFLQHSLGAPYPGSHEGGPAWGSGPRGGVSASAVEQLEALLRQREGELASYSSRLASLEGTRDALAEELVRTTQATEELGREAALLPSLRAELEALRRRHASALELMGERDEEVEELRADLQDHKSMYREQIDMLVKQIERQSKSNLT